MTARTARILVAAAVCGAVTVTAAVMLTSDASSRHRSPSRSADGSGASIQRGFAMPAYSREGYQSRSVPAQLRRMADVGATWVQLNPTWYQSDVAAATIAPTDQTPSDASVTHAVEAAHKAGLKVFLKPLVDLSPAGGYRGNIRPTDSAAWFASYTAFIGHYAELAERTGVEEFALGTELAGVCTDRAGWLGVAQAVRARYHGPLLYAANFDEYRNVAFWDAVDLVGIDAYWPVSQHPTADENVLRPAWSPIVAELATFASRVGRRVLFAEAGYTSQRGSTTAPWSWTVSTTPDQAEQAAAYQVLLASLDGQPWWEGVFWWAWDVPPDSGASDPLNYSPRGKAAEAVVRRWWN